MFFLTLLLLRTIMEAERAYNFYKNHLIVPKSR